MPNKSKRSWRLKFIDIDSSFVINSYSTPLSAAFPCRAPKGETRGYFFGPNNKSAIDAMIGVGSADWPDILEAESFNEEYSVYISAPPGDSLIYPSHLGGFYVTRQGIYKFFDVKDKDDIKLNSEQHAYKARVRLGEEEFFSRKTAGAPKTEVTIYAPEVAAEFDAPAPNDWLHFKPTANPTDPCYMTFVAPAKLGEPSFIQYDVMKNGYSSTPIKDPSNTREMTVSLIGTWGVSVDNHGWTFAIDPTTNATVATLDCFGFSSAAERAEGLKTWLGPKIYSVLVDPATGQFTTDGEGWIVELLTNGYFYTPDGPDLDLDPDLYQIPFTLQNMFFYGMDIADITYCAFWQKSCTEKQTKIYIQDVGYDKYMYDYILPYAEAPTTGMIVATADGPEDIVLIDPVSKLPLNIARKKVDENSSTIPQPYYYSEEADSEYLTRVFCMFEPLQGQARIPEVEKKFFKVFNSGDIRHLYTEEECAEEAGDEMAIDTYNAYMANSMAAIKDWRFNYLKVACEEVVYNGQVTSGGVFEGSIDINGKNLYGDQIYFPEVLSEDDFAFIEVLVNKKFNEDGDDLDNGFWKWDRVIDKYDLDADGFKPTERTFTIEGDRYCTFLMNANLAAKYTGGAFSSITEQGYTQILTAALREFMAPDYDDAVVIVEPTGEQVFKPLIKEIRENSEKSGGPQTVITPFLIGGYADSKGYISDKAVQKINIPIRGTGMATYAGEFLVHDSVTGKNYWRKPIGDVALNLVRIMDKKLGGWAPAWLNLAGGLGGQLKTTCKTARFTFEDEATHTMDTKGINPIIYDVDNGVMIVSQKTLQDPNQLSDWSFLGHTMSFDMVKREIRNSVMIPQIMKPINDYWMTLRQTQVESILAQRISGSSPIWAVAKCDIKGQNNDFTKMNRNFVIRVDIKVNPFSEIVTLVLENHSQQWSG